MGKHRELVLRTAKTLIKNKGVFGFTMKDLADASELSVGSLYKEIKNKDDLLLNIFLDSERYLYGIADELDEVTSLSPAEKMIVLFGFPAYIQLFYKNPTGTNFLGSNPALYSRGSSEAIIKLESTVTRLLECYKQHCNLWAKRWIANYKTALFNQVLDDLLVTGRGMLVLASSELFQREYPFVEKLCHLGRKSTDDLDWLADYGQVEPQRVALAMKTLLDQKLLPNLIQKYC